MTRSEFLTLLPFITLVGGAILLYLVTRFARLDNKVEAVLAAIILVTVIVELAVQANQFDPAAPGSPLAFERFHLQASLTGIFLMGITCLIAIPICIYSGEYLAWDARYIFYYPLVLILITGLLGMFYTTDLYHLFILAELTTITATGLTAFRFNQRWAVQAGYQYLVMSSLGTMIMLLGVYFVFHDTGSINLGTLTGQHSRALSAAAACFLLGFGIKAGVVPLHTWMPDVYANAPSAISGLFASVTSKSMLFILPGICLKLNLSEQDLGKFLLAFSIANMVIGVLGMLRQQNLRRFLAFSSIVHTGYLMYILGIYFVFQQPAAMSAALFSFFAIALLKILAFLAVGIYEFRLELKTISEASGVYQLMGFNTMCFTAALAGLAGIPLFAGFIAKWLIYAAAIATRDPLVLAGLAVFLLTSVIALINYLSVIVQLFKRDPAQQPFVERVTHISPWMRVTVAVLGAAAIFVGIFPSSVLDLIAMLAERIRF